MAEISCQGRWITGNRDDSADRGIRQGAGLGLGAGPWRIEDNGIERPQFLRRQGCPREIAFHGVHRLAGGGFFHRRHHMGIPLESLDLAKSGERETQGAAARIEIGDALGRADSATSGFRQDCRALAARLEKITLRKGDRCAGQLQDGLAPEDQWLSAVAPPPGNSRDIVSLGEFGEMLANAGPGRRGSARQEQQIEAAIRFGDPNVAASGERTGRAEQFAQGRDRGRNGVGRHWAFLEIDDPTAPRVMKAEARSAAAVGGKFDPSAGSRRNRDRRGDDIAAESSAIQGFHQDSSFELGCFNGRDML